MSTEAMERAYAQNPFIGRKRLSDITGVAVTTCRKFLAQKRDGTAVAPATSTPSKDDVSVDYSSDKATISTSSTSITTLDEALDAAKVDRSKWEVERHIVNWWDVTFKTEEGSETKRNFQIKVWLKPYASIPARNALKELADELKLHGPVAISPMPFSTVEPHLLEISVVDLHFGKLAWAAETGTDYDCKIAETLFITAVTKLLETAKGFGVEQILFPIGSDFLHINNQSNTTAHNTPQDTDSRLVKIFKSACKVVIKAVELCAEVAPVKVVYVPGNHDAETSFYLCAYVDAWFNRHEGVTVDVGPSSRKYHRYGVNLIGFTHGDQERHDSLPLIMAGERAEDWSTAKHREWHVGHIHKSKEVRYVAGDTYGPVVVRILPSLSGTDAWHYGKGYVCGRRAAEAYLYSSVNGYAGHFSANV